MAFVLCVADPGDAIERDDEVLPHAALALEDAPAGGGEAVIAAAPLALAFDPAPVDEAVGLEAVERGVERSDMERDRAVDRWSISRPMS